MMWLTFGRLTFNTSFTLHAPSDGIKGFLKLQQKYYAAMVTNDDILPVKRSSPRVYQSKK